jgi:hypothetical protein
VGKRKCVFNVNLQQEYKFLKLCNDSDSERVQCTLCNGVGIEEGIQVKLLHFDEVPSESAEILAQYILQCVKKYKLEEKLVSYTADNT